MGRSRRIRARRRHCIQRVARVSSQAGFLGRWFGSCCREWLPFGEADHFWPNVWQEARFFPHLSLADTISGMVRLGSSVSIPG